MLQFFRRDQNTAPTQRKSVNLRLAALVGCPLIVMLMTILIIGLSRGATQVKAAGDYTQGVTALSSTQAKIWFTPTIPAALVDVHYLVNGANQQNFRMTNNSGTWTQTVGGLTTGATLEYWFTYEKNGLNYDSTHYTYIQGSSGATPTPATGDYTQGITVIDGTHAKIVFTSLVHSAWVDVHYTINSGGQQNFRMTLNSATGAWEQSLSGLAAGNVIQYAFTYENAGHATDTGWGSYIFTGIAGGPTATPIPTSGPTATIPAGGSGTFPLTFQNNTRGIKANSQIYVLIFLLNTQGQWCHLTAAGAVVPVNPNDANAPNHLSKNGVNYANYSFTLAQASTITMPTYIAGGRVYMSIGSPMFIPIYANGWGGPNLNNPADPNLDVVFDWYELAYGYQQTAFGGNTTQVDMFGFPITARLQQTATGYDRTVGITLTRDQVFAQYTAAVGAAFQPLATAARIVAPRSSAAFAPGGAQANYLQPLIDQMWSQYATTPFTLNRQGDIFAGQVVNGRFQFTKNGAGPYYIDKPTSTDVVACAGTLATGSAIEKDLEAQFCAALNRGVALNTANWGNPATYYTSNPKNDYAQFFHQISLGHLAYGFPFDDVNNQSSVAILPNANPPSSLTISIGW